MPNDLAPDRPPGPIPWRGKDILLSFSVGILGAIVGALGLVLAASGLELELSRTATFVVLGTTTYASLSLATWVFCVRRKGMTLAALGFSRTGLGPLVAMIPLSVGLLVLNGILILVTSGLTGRVENPQTDALAPGGVLTLSNFIWLLFLISVVAPIGEEMIFRGMIYRYMRAREGVVIAVIASAALFALAHVIPVLLAPLFVLGVALAIVTERSSSLFPAITLHALNNAISLTLIFLASSRG
ncbi:MAG: lysostaphin resistance A-like protein [Actinomycetota bacterium]